ncbi:MAG: hypothetical protein WCG29_10350 [Desulfomonile sp.]
MRIGIIFHKNPLGPPTGIDLVRLRAIAGGLRRKGIDAEIIAPIERESLLDGFIPVRPPAALDKPGSYDLVKTSYHYSILLLGKFTGPVVSRIVRVVDDRLPERDEPFREKLLQCQKIISARARVVSLNNIENLQRWNHFFGGSQRTILVPTGCPATIPVPHENPFSRKTAPVLFLGSIAAPRMIQMLNDAARNLEGLYTIHLVGANKTLMYGGRGWSPPLDERIVDHGEISEEKIWDYIRHASVGLALATGPHAFDNDLAKIYNYLRGGLPVLSEEPVLNNHLIRQTNFGKIIGYGDVNGLVAGVQELVTKPPAHGQEVMDFMVREHSWEKRVETYIELFETLLRELKGCRIIDGPHLKPILER